MGDNLKVILSKEDAESLIKSMDIHSSEYCMLSCEEDEEVIIITTNDGLKLILIKHYDATEMSDWNFNELYQKDKDRKQYIVVGESNLLNKGY